MNFRGLKLPSCLVVSALLFGCASPTPSVGYKNGLDQVYWQSGEYAVDVTGEMETKLFLSPRNQKAGMSESYFDLLRLDSGMVLDVTGKAYLAYSFSTESVDKTVGSISGLWMGGTEERLMIVIKNDGCEAYLHDIRLFNEPIVEGCGVSLSFSAK
ncbi:hypothetical protein DFX32_RS17700 [Vibrio parahaemolyticus]|uniref:hypothetical protein n=1 Tax=Vibrio harveyi group TaxID=717610 RepID=UPI001AA0CA5B|nr:MULTISPECIES: hypothetical protein [Vibrio harveyi group]EGQ8329960.1 hypothetical protein [Vibrio parahaemolyticus]EGQ8789155.1 hypothetical protein [Vibrio parahaemolyticus]EGQ8818462.1 hypothetical protein [Vibrio parahaemolyticus]EGQ8848045.1 hypothetical protein [Vibrio parahaemolyticus]EJG0296503.1 hypothetical protein [Vibrio parahaemolyticus]